MVIDLHFDDLKLTFHLSDHIVPFFPSLDWGSLLPVCCHRRIKAHRRGWSHLYTNTECFHTHLPSHRWRLRKAAGQVLLFEISEFSDGTHSPCWRKSSQANYRKKCKYIDLIHAMKQAGKWSTFQLLKLGPEGSPTKHSEHVSNIWTYIQQRDQKGNRWNL